MPDPISLGIQRSIPSFVRRYSDPQFAGLPPVLLNPLMQLDYNRATRGQTPIPKNRVPGILEALTTGESATPKTEHQNILERFGADVKGLVTSLPKLPAALVQEVKELPQAPKEIGTAIQSGDLSKIAEAPGIRLLPGAYIAAEGRDALEHPLFAALDVAPYTKMLGKAVGKTAFGAAIKAETALRADRLGIGPVSRETSRVTAQLRRKVAIHTAEYNEGLNKLALQHNLSHEDVVRLSGIGRRTPAQRPNLPANERMYLDAVELEAERHGQRMEAAGLLGKFRGEYYSLGDYNSFIKLEKGIQTAINNGDAKKAGQLSKQFQRLYETHAPMRFRPLLIEQFQHNLTRLARSNYSRLASPTIPWSEVEASIKDGLWDRIVPVVTKKEMLHLARSVQPVWETMKSQGLNPIFLHTVAPEQVTQMTRATVFPATKFTPSQIKQATWNVKPGVEDFSIGLGHAEYEWVRENLTDTAIKELAATYGKPKKVVQDMYIAEARGRAPRTGSSTAVELQAAMDRDWVEWVPETIFPWRPPRQLSGLTKSEPMMMPKAFAKTIQDIYKYQPHGFKGAFDKTTKLFRTSILPLSPRWHTYNLIGGAVMLMARTDPSVIRFFAQARKMVKEGTLPEELSRGFFEIPDESRLAYAQQARRFGKLASEREKLAQGAQTLERQTVGRAYNFAENVDSMYRALAYLYGTDKKLTKGMGAKEAREAGIKLSNKVLQDWDAMVPFERQTLRTFIPFYGWMRHMLQYALTYPWDHPYRASILSNFARNEIEDWQTGLPQQFQNYLYFGKDEQGNQRAVNIKGANPFADVANYLSLSGFVGQLHPLVGGLMEAMGMNTQTGKADLYPELTYNEQTGRLEPKTPNAAISVAESVFPPLPLIRGLTGFATGEEREMKMASPQAYRASMFSAAGIPFVPRTVNKQLETARAELRRQDKMQLVWNDALRSGDWSEAMQYPALRTLLEQLRPILESGQLDQLKLQATPQGIVDPAQLLQNIGGQP